MRSIATVVVFVAAGCSRQPAAPTTAAAPAQAPLTFPVTNIVIHGKPRVVTETEVVEVAPVDWQKEEERRLQRMTLIDDRKKEDDRSNERPEGIRR
jgi:hypothetical protein